MILRIVGAALFVTCAFPALAQPAPPNSGSQSASVALKSYKRVMVTAPAPIGDPAFEDFRKQLAEVAEKKDRKALGSLVASDVFWLSESGEKADKKKSGLDNLAGALGLDDKDGNGWDMLAAAAGDATGNPFPSRKDTICAPADPAFDGKAFDELVKATGTNEGDWVFPAQDGVEVRATAQPNAPVAEKLGMHFVYAPADDSASGSMLKIITPTGKAGFVPADMLLPLGSDQVCYSKESGGWKISGVVGGSQ